MGDNIDSSVENSHKEFKDDNQDGLPDKLTDFLSNSDFRSDWKNRRKVIYMSLLGMGVLFALIVVASLVTLFTNTTVDMVLGGLISTCLWVISISYVTVAGTYVFGAQFDISNYRSSIVSIVESVNKKSN